MGETITILGFLVGALALAARGKRARGPLVDGIEALAAAGAGVTLAATSVSPVVIAASGAIAIAAVTQQYAALVAAAIAPHHAPLVGRPLGLPALVGMAGYLALGQPPLLLAAIASWCAVDALWTSIVRGIAIAQLDRAKPRPPALPRLAGRARWRRLGEGLASSRDTAFWGLVVARPLARVMLQLVAEQRWITPNRITVVSIAACVAAAFAIVEGDAAIAIALIGARSVLDSLDGQLARYRACGTSLGSYVDKVSDLFCWSALFGALGLRAYAVDDAPALLLLPLVAALVNALFGFALWLARALVPATPIVAPPAQLGLAAWAKSLWRIVRFEEPDFYLWIALAVATARYDLFVPFIAGAYVVRALVLAFARLGIARLALA